MSEQEMIARLQAWVPEYDDRVEPLLQSVAALRDSDRWNYEDAEVVIAFLLTTLASRTPEGMVMVPREPTEAMIERGWVASGILDAPAQVKSIWAAMLAASPTPSPEGAE